MSRDWASWQRLQELQLPSGDCKEIQTCAAGSKTQPLWWEAIFIPQLQGCEASAVTPALASSDAVASQAISNPVERELEQRVPKRQPLTLTAQTIALAFVPHGSLQWTSQFAIASWPKIPSHVSMLMPLILSYVLLHQSRKLVGEWWKLYYFIDIFQKCSINIARSSNLGFRVTQCASASALLPSAVRTW